MDKTYICKEEASNKFWGYTRNDNDMTVTAQWGRLGLDGQKKIHQFDSNWEISDFISKKTHEKLRGGYGEVTPEQYEVEVAMAKTIGVDQKVDQLLFVEEKGRILTSLDATKLHNPDLKPYVYAKLVGKLKDGIHPVTEFMFTPAESFIVETHGSSNLIGIGSKRSINTMVKINPEDDSAKMAAAVEEVVGRVLF